jgi:hypothetical protein
LKSTGEGKGASIWSLRKEVVRTVSGLFASVEVLSAFGLYEKIRYLQTVTRGLIFVYRWNVSYIQVVRKETNPLHTKNATNIMKIIFLAPTLKSMGLKFQMPRKTCELIL